MISTQRARSAVGALFFANGALMATWVSRIPAIQEQHRLSHETLGLLLLAAAGGAVAAMPVAGRLIGRLGSAAICALAAPIYAVALPLLAWAPGTAALAMALALFGAAHGALDVSMNAQAVEVERRYARPIMSSFHALFSAGGLFGALVGAAFAHVSITPRVHLGVMGILLGGTAGVGVLALCASHTTGKEKEDSRGLCAGGGRGADRADDRWPNTNGGRQERFVEAARWDRGSYGWVLVALGAVALCSMMGEGAMADWGALYLREVRHATESVAAAGYAAFSVTMAALRLVGDRLTVRLGPKRLVQAGGATACAGVVSALLLPGQLATLLGFAAVGAGLATIVPTAFSAAGRLPNLPPGLALSTVTTLGYLGFIAGPPLIGFAAQSLGLRLALATLVCTSCAIMLLANVLEWQSGAHDQLKAQSGNRASQPIPA